VNPIIDLLKRTNGTTFVNEDGVEGHFALLSPMSVSELAKLESTLPCRLPPDMRELLQFASGFDSGGALEEIRFDASDGFGMEDIFPHALPLAADGFGNYWIVDLTRESITWGPIFYACHDAPVIVYQTDSLLRFVEEVIRFSGKPWKSELDDVHEELSTRIWRENPDVLTREQALSGGDPNLIRFAESLDDSWLFVDLRNPKLGDGFSWGRYGPKTLNRRFGEERIFAYQKKSLGRRFLDAWR